LQQLLSHLKTLVPPAVFRPIDQSINLFGGAGTRLSNADRRPKLRSVASVPEDRIRQNRQTHYITVATHHFQPKPLRRKMVNGLPVHEQIRHHRDPPD